MGIPYYENKGGKMGKNNNNKRNNRNNKDIGNIYRTPPTYNKSPYYYLTIQKTRKEERNLT
jgi:hypothetical protein